MYRVYTCSINIACDGPHIYIYMPMKTKPLRLPIEFPHVNRQERGARTHKGAFFLTIKIVELF